MIFFRVFSYSKLVIFIQSRILVYLAFCFERYSFVIKVAIEAINAETLAIGTPTIVAPTPVVVKVPPTITPLVPVKISNTMQYIDHFLV